MNNKISYTFWQHVNHAVVIGAGLAFIVKSIFVLSGCGTVPLTPFRVILYGGFILLFVPYIPYYVYKTYIKEETP